MQACQGCERVHRVAEGGGGPAGMSVTMLFRISPATMLSSRYSVRIPTPQLIDQ